MEARQEIETANEMRAVANNGGRRHRQVRTSCLKAFYVPPKPSHEAVAGDKTGTQVETGKLARGCALQPGMHSIRERERERERDLQTCRAQGMRDSINCYIDASIYWDVHVLCTVVLILRISKCSCQG
jgi:hypothetical protein